MDGFFIGSLMHSSGKAPGGTKQTDSTNEWTQHQQAERKLSDL